MSAAKRKQGHAQEKIPKTISTSKYLNTLPSVRFLHFFGYKAQTCLN
ncbi:MAG: hypothetical protein NZ455_08135 [Bacteroidia bacterium]|nr:hypothetical protein [Bacteroidia bacterium]